MRGREGGGRAEGRILRVLGRAHPTVVGVFRYGARGNVVLPYEARLHEEVVIPPGDELTPELLASMARPPESHGAAEASLTAPWLMWNSRVFLAAACPARDA